jgi:hypothetical protein
MFRCPGRAGRLMTLSEQIPLQLRYARNLISEGREVVPAWHIDCPDGPWIILTPLDQQRDRVVHLVRRFMAWKSAQSFVRREKIWLGPFVTGLGQHAIAVVGCSRSRSFGVMQLVKRAKGVVDFGPPVRLSRTQLDSFCSELLPLREETVPAEEVAKLEAVFGEHGEFRAFKVS